jgi:nitrogen fixation/metabolism regulation signal transduction histidine kinase
MDDHAGRMELGARDEGGASVKLRFKRPQSSKG